MRGPAVALLALAAAGCGGDRPQTVEVTEAPAGAEAVRRPPFVDTTYADSGLFVDPRLRPDSLRADSLRADSLRQDSLARVEAARPDFRAFWPTFREAARAGRPAVAGLTAFSDSLPEPDFAALYDATLGRAPFRDGLLGLTPRDFRRAGTWRAATVTVGYDADGAVVPEDEAVREASVEFAFDVVDGAYRLVRVGLGG